MKEKNRETLMDAIGHLPKYRPPENLWANIAEKLEAETSYRQALAELPVYQAPEGIWKGIEAQLDAAPKSGRARVRFLTPIRAAAAVVLLLLAGWLVKERFAGPGYTLIYGEENVYQAQADEDLQDEQLIAVLLKEAGQSPVAEFPEFQALRTELGELDAARAEVVQMMDRYGREDEHLAVQLSDIEKQRTTVVKKMAEMI